MEDVGTFATDRDVPASERDAELAIAARSDPAAFGLLCERHRLAVFRYLRTRTTSEDDAADLTAIAFERALAAMPRYRPTGGGFPVRRPLARPGTAQATLVRSPPYRRRQRI